MHLLRSATEGFLSSLYGIETFSSLPISMFRIDLLLLSVYRHPYDNGFSGAS